MPVGDKRVALVGDIGGRFKRLSLPNSAGYYPIRSIIKYYQQSKSIGKNCTK